MKRVLIFINGAIGGGGIVLKTIGEKIIELCLITENWLLK